MVELPQFSLVMFPKHLLSLLQQLSYKSKSFCPRNNFKNGQKQGKGCHRQNKSEESEQKFPAKNVEYCQGYDRKTPYNGHRAGKYDPS